MGIANICFSILKRDSLITIFNLITSVLVARKLGIEALGIWSIIRIISTYLEAFGRSRADQASVYYLNQKEYSTNDILFNLNIINILNIALIYLVIGINYAYFYDFFFGKINEPFFLEFNLTLLTIPFIFFYTSYCYYFAGIEDYFSYNRIISINAIATYCSTFLLILFSDFQLWSLVLVYLISPLIACIYAFIKIKNSNLSFLGKLNFKIIKDLQKYGLQFYINGVFAEIFQSGTNLIAIKLLSPSYVGLITQSRRLSNLINRFISPLEVPLYSKISKSNFHESNKLAMKAFRVSVILVLIFALLLTLIIRPIVLLLYGEDFLAITNIFYILLPGIIFENIVGVLKTYCHGIGKAIISTYVQIVPCIAQIVLSWLFIKTFGYLGAPLGLSMGLIIYGVTYILWFKYFTKAKNINLIPNMSDFILVKSYINKLSNNFLKKV